MRASDLRQALSTARTVLSKSATLTPFMKAKVSPGRLEAYNGEVHLSMALDVDWPACLVEVDPIVAWLRTQPEDGEVKLKDGTLHCKRSRLKIPLDFESVYEYPEPEGFTSAFDTVNDVVERIQRWVFPSMGGDIELLNDTFGVWFIHNNVFATNNMSIGLAELDQDQFFEGYDSVVVPPSFIVPLCKVATKDPLVSLKVTDDDRTQATFKSGTVLTCTNITHGLDLDKVRGLIRLVTQDAEPEVQELGDLRNLVNLTSKLSDDDHVKLVVDSDDLHVIIDGPSYSFDEKIERVGRVIKRGSYEATVFASFFKKALGTGGSQMFFTEDALIISDGLSYSALARI